MSIYYAHMSSGEEAWSHIVRNPDALHRQERADHGWRVGLSNEDRVLEMLAQLTEQVGPYEAAKIMFAEEEVFDE